VIPAIDKVSSLNLTSELDLLKKHPNIKYLFLPYDTKIHNPSFESNSSIRICHSPTNRFYKGSDTIIPICEELASKNENVEFILIENRSHSDTLAIKKTCDIFIDQVHNRGGWGYGMNSVEALSMGLCCVTELVNEYVEFIPDHPFVNVTGDNLLNTLKNLIDNSTKILEYKKKAREWVVNKHDLTYTAEKLYEYYHEKGWL
jgi:glycosyltransferase involved in cell wall biosynthesis